MRIVVTGATGNVGTALVERLLEVQGGAGTPDGRPHEVVGLARRAPAWTADRLEWRTADLGSTTTTVADLADLFSGADAVVHLAWAFQPTHQPLVTWATNAVGSRKVFDAAVAAGVGTLVHASSVGAYSPGPDDRRVDESWPTDAHPTAAYGREKSYVERALDAVELRRPEMRVVRLRPAFIFQRVAAHEQRRIFAGSLLPSRVLAARKVPVLPWPGNLTFQALHAADAAEAYRLALVTEIRGAVNVAAEPVMAAEQLADLVGASKVVRVPVAAARAAMATGWHLRALPAEPALLDLAVSLPTMDTTRARTELGWQPRMSAVEAVGSFVRGVGDPETGLTPALESPAGVD